MVTPQHMQSCSLHSPLPTIGSLEACSSAVAEHHHPLPMRHAFPCQSLKPADHAHPGLRNYAILLCITSDHRIISHNAWKLPIGTIGSTEEICRSKPSEAKLTLCRHRKPSFPISVRFQEMGHMDGCCLRATAVDRLACAWVHLYLCPLAWAPGDASAPLAYSC